MDPREQAFLDCYESSADAVYRHAYWKTSDPELARDITQESYLRAWNALSEGKQIENLKAFIFRTATNLIIDHYRKKKMLSLDTLAESGFDPGEEDTAVLGTAEAREALAAVAALEEPYRETLLLRYATGLDIREIAAIAGESENAISVRIHRGLEKLRTILKP
jgi:RNA polymerase sigma-70 factor (ECF subfamily)